MPTHANEEIYESRFPYSFFTALAAFNFQGIPKMYIFITNLPPGATARARFGRLEALQESPRTLHRPSLSIQDQSITFPVSLQPGWYLEFQGDDAVRVFDPNGHTMANVKPEGTIPILKQGDNLIRFSCDRSQGHAEAAKITLISQGNPLH